MNTLQNIIVFALVIVAVCYLILKMTKKSKGDTCGACDKK